MSETVEAEPGTPKPERRRPRWLFWVEAIGAVLGLILAVVELTAAFIDDDSPLAPIIKDISFFSEPAICNPNTLTLTRYELCLSRGGLEGSLEP